MPPRYPGRSAGVSGDGSWYWKPADLPPFPRTMTQGLRPSVRWGRTAVTGSLRVSSEPAEVAEHEHERSVARRRSWGMSLATTAVYVHHSREPRGRRRGQRDPRLTSNDTPSARADSVDRSPG